ncbi:MAG: fluoride efflux transporter CrcB [Epsilonproteobacteria bacterium]|nr:fluoride efflux transporter CrcB [Campylobacterota bacterium]
MNLSLILFVGIGGFVGAILRFLISTFVQKATISFFPLGTLSVNVIGSFIIGFLVLYFENVISPNYKALLVTGFLGALTTFSTFSYETVAMIQSSEYMKAFLNIFLNIVLCLSATIAGISLFKLIYR